MDNSVAIIDPISSGRRYGREAKAMGLSPIAVLTGTAMPEPLKRFASVESFDEVHCMGSMEDTAQFLRSQRVKAVIPGHHFALRVVDTIAAKLGLVGNPVGSIKARVNKLAMKQRLRERGVNATRSRGICTKTLSDFDSFDMTFPVVVKPSEGSGSLNVKICRRLDELASGLAAIELLDRVYSGADQLSLIEEYIEGPEYFVTTANYGDGSKQLLCFAKYDKLEMGDRPSIYKNIYSLPVDSNEAQIAFRYACAVNQALDVNYGINDIELKLTPQGPRIIELNNRLPGANVPFLIEQCTGVNCYQLNLDIFSDCIRSGSQVVHYRKHFCICCLINDADGTVVSIRGIELVKALPGVIGIDLMTDIGQHVHRTVDFITTWGFVYMVHEDPQVLQRNAKFIHDIARLDVVRTLDGSSS